MRRLAHAGTKMLKKAVYVRGPTSTFLCLACNILLSKVFRSEAGSAAAMVLDLTTTRAHQGRRPKMRVGYW